MLGLVGALKDAASSPVETIAPELPIGPLTCQVTGALEFCTAAENCRVAPLTTFAVLGEILTLTGGATTVRVVPPETDVSVTRRAVIVTTGGLGIVDGAV
jgi:hypothetical protein